MKILMFVKWIFVYLPGRFSMSLILLILWFLLVAWPKIIYEDDNAVSYGRSEPAAEATRQFDKPASLKPEPPIWVRFLNPENIDLPWWAKLLNLEPAARALFTLLILFAGILIAYNLSTLFYRVTRKWSPVMTVVLATALLLAYPWVVLLDQKFIPDGTRPLVPFGWLGNVGWLWRTPYGNQKWAVIWFYAPLLFPIAVCLIRWLVRRFYWKEIVCSMDVCRKAGANDVFNKSFAERRRDGQFKRIGIILSGGGAKGVYQAGALKAIDEFLRLHGAREDVRMISGTSIGAWNSLFWLADLVYAEPGKSSSHEKWWTAVDVKRVIQFDWYVPFRKNSFFLNDPWQENFDQIFAQKEVKERLERLWKISDPSRNEASTAAATAVPPRFYLTRSNVGRAHLEFSTNWDQATREQARRHFPQDRYFQVTSLEDLKQAVFASMDLPPLFPYMSIECETFEDGGVIDNLPIVFGTDIEQCDLLFVLLLNASFEAEPNHTSILQRLMRVMDVRQGVLERNSLKLTYLFNEKFALGKQLQSQAGLKPADLAAGIPKAPVMVVAICPDRPLKVGTAAFWKTGEFGCAFKVMYESARTVLEKFEFDVDLSNQKDPASWIKIKLISPQGLIREDDDL
jgi:predicted acylesterase/phospholipase RssA